MARPKGFEPLTPRFVVWCSIQLSYGRFWRREAILGSLSKGKVFPLAGVGRVRHPLLFGPSPRGNVQISHPSGIVLPCPCPARWLRLAATSPPHVYQVRMGLGFGAISLCRAGALALRRA